MSLLNYPETDAHILEHRDFEKQVKNMINNQSIFDETFANDLTEFLTNWLNHHIFGIDKDLEKFILASEAK